MAHSVVFLFLLVVAGLSTVYSQRPCEGGLSRKRWGGKCFGTQDDVYPRKECCGIIYNQTLSGCPNGTTGPQACCLNCTKQTSRCQERYDEKSYGSNDVCGPTPLSLRVGHLPASEIAPGSGCYCCRECIPKPTCSGISLEFGISSRCITRQDPKYNPDWCLENGGTIKKRRCIGDGCWCCLFPTE